LTPTLPVSVLRPAYRSQTLSLPMPHPPPPASRLPPHRAPRRPQSRQNRPSGNATPLLDHHGNRRPRLGPQTSHPIIWVQTTA
jgi:hypothetical protein